MTFGSCILPPYFNRYWRASFFISSMRTAYSDGASFSMAFMASDQSILERNSCTCWSEEALDSRELVMPLGLLLFAETMIGGWYDAAYLGLLEAGNGFKWLLAIIRSLVC